MKLILASTSSYRRELLQRLQIPFTCRKPEVDEDTFKKRGFAPRELARQLARAKALAVWESAEDKEQTITIGSDQVICLGEQLYSKPVTPERALQQLQSMRGKTHQLITAVGLFGANTDVVFEVDAKLTMRQEITDEELLRYIAADQPLDCAGSYKIESLGISLFSQIECSDFTTITGLPLLRLSQHLRQLGFRVP